MIAVTIGICAYNEEKNIGKLLQLLLNQKTNNNIRIDEIIVVSSACSDNTDKIIESFKLKDDRIDHIIQTKREGKASAINLILKKATGDIIVIASADIIPLEDTINTLVSPFFDKKVGMTGGHPIPVDDKDTFICFTIHLIWKLHHRLALKDPKLGEIIAFRNIITEIPINTAVDEVSIEAIIRKKGLDLIYVPEAIIYNKGASTINDFLCQRRRIHAGHLHQKKNLGYSPSSMKIMNLVPIMFDGSSNLKEIYWTIGAISLEAYGRLLGMYDFYIAKKNPYIWDVAETTKEINHEK